MSLETLPSNAVDRPNRNEDGADGDRQRQAGHARDCEGDHRGPLDFRGSGQP